jgi:uncharacterized repeat protein (TIGR02543 family)
MSDIFVKTTTTTGWRKASKIFVKTTTTTGWKEAAAVWIRNATQWLRVWPLSGIFATRVPFIADFSSDAYANRLTATSKLRIGTSYFGDNAQWDLNGWTASSYTYRWKLYDDLGQELGVTLRSGTGSGWTSTAGEDQLPTSIWTATNSTNADRQYLGFEVTANNSSNIQYNGLSVSTKIQIVREKPIISTGPTLSNTSPNVGSIINYSSGWNTSEAYKPEAGRTTIAWYRSTSNTLTESQLRSLTPIQTSGYSYTVVQADDANYIYAMEEVFNSGTDLESLVNGVTAIAKTTSLTANTYTVSYNANGGAGAPASQVKTHGVTLTLSSTAPTRTNFIFNGWNTASDGSGTNYSSGGSYTANASVTLYAKWTAIQYTVTWNANGGTVSPTSNTVNAGSAVTAPTPTRAGYTLSTWRNPLSGGDPILVSSGGSYTPTSNIEFFAIWIANTYTVSYNANGGTGAPASQTKTHDVALTLSSTAPTRATVGNTQYTFAGWNTAANGTGTSYAAGASYTLNAALSLFAIWTETTLTWTVTWNANGGTGGGTTTLARGLAHTAPSPGTRAGYTFNGYYNTPTGDYLYGPIASGGTFTPTATTTMTARWSVTPIIPTITMGANSGVSQTAGTINWTSTNQASFSSTGTFSGSGTTATSISKTGLTAGTNYTGTVTVTSSTGHTASTNYSLTTSVAQYTVTWNANGGTGGGSTTQNAGVAHTAPSPGTRSGYTFNGYYNTPSGDFTYGPIASGGSFNPPSTITMYARWSQVVVPGSVSSITGSTGGRTGTTFWNDPKATMRYTFANTTSATARIQRSTDNVTWQSGATESLSISSNVATQSTNQPTGNTSSSGNFYYRAQVISINGTTLGTPITSASFRNTVTPISNRALYP